jgi:hypothetical protein
VSPVDARIVVLIEEIRRDWAAVRRHAARAGGTDPAADEARAALVALSLDHAYQALETMLLRIERALGLAERTGASWHVQLLADASLPLATLRPAIVPREAVVDWERLMKFRHFLRHAYTVELDADRLRENAERLRRAVDGTEGAIQALIAALEAQ